MTNPPLWKASVNLRKAEAPDVMAVLEITPPQAVLTAEEPFKDECTVEALYDVMPDGELLSKVVGRDMHVQLLPDTDWIKLSPGRPAAGAGGALLHLWRARQGPCGAPWPSLQARARQLGEAE